MGTITEFENVKKLEPGRYIVIHASDLGRALEVLDEDIQKRFQDINYDGHEIKIGKDVIVAISSADPKFYMGIEQNTALNDHDIQNFIANIPDDNTLEKLLKRFNLTSAALFMAQDMRSIKISAIDLGIVEEPASRLTQARHFFLGNDHNK